MEAVANGRNASDFHQTAINGPKFTLKKGNTVSKREKAIELIRFVIVRVRFAAFGGVWITNRLLSLCVRPRRECQTTILPVYPACTSVQRFCGFSQFCCFVVSITCASSTPLIVRSPPPLTAPLIAPVKKTRRRSTASLGQ
jgi:hypothetical protein